MSIPQPLGVRIYSPSISFDQYVTSMVSGLSFRSTAPGGFASATIKIRRMTPINAPDSQKWTSPTSAASADNSTFKVTDANATGISVGDRFWVLTAGALRFNGARYTVLSKSSSGGTTTVTYFPSTSAPVASGDTVLCNAPNYFANGDLIGFNKWILLFNRIQVVDLRTMEIVWEGRIEDPARETEKNTWTIGTLGNSVYATDIKAPVYYLDSDVSSWLPYDTKASSIESVDIDDGASIIKLVGLNPSTITTSSYFPGASFEKKRATGQYYGRLDGIYDGNDNTATPGRLAINLDVFGSAFGNAIATYPLNSSVAAQHFNRKVGTDFADGAYKFNLIFGNRNTTSNVSIAQGGNYGSLRLPRVQAQRMDRWRNLQNTGASYPNGGLRVWEVVEDVMGRFLNGGHSSSGADIPFWGSINPYTSYVDTSYQALMVYGWTFYDGATAKDILDKICNEAQTNAYWAIWESSFGGTDDSFLAKCRFEFTQWPNSWGYQISSQDGLSEQPDGTKEYNYVWYQYKDSSADTQPANQVLWSQEFWNGGVSSDVNYLQVNRGTTVVGGDMDSNAAFNNASAWIIDNSRGSNSGSVTVKRPILYYDNGNNSNSGGARRLDPWMIRPGKVARIYDLLPRAMMNSMPYASTLPNRILDDCIFRVAAVEWSSDDNSAKLDLDEIASWDISTQIVASRGKTKTQVVYR